MKKSFLSLLMVLVLLLGACNSQKENKTDTLLTEQTVLEPSVSQNQDSEETTDPMDEPPEYIGVYGAFTDAVVQDETTALKAVEQAADTLGLTQPQEQLQVESTMEYDNHTYYRMQRYCNDIPVFGNQVVLAAGEDGKVVSMTASKPVTDCEVTQPELDPQTAADSLSLYFHEVISAPESLTRDQLCYYPMEDGTLKLGYCLDLIESNLPYQVILDAVDGTVLFCQELIYTETCYNADGTISFNGYKDDDDRYYMHDEVNGIVVYTMNGISSEITNEDGVKINQLYLAQALSSSDNRFGNTDAEAALEMEKGITLLQNLIKIKDFFREQYYAPEYAKLQVYYNDAFDDGTNGYATLGIQNGMIMGVIAIGAQKDVSSIDLLAHEYMHLVEMNVVGSRRDGGIGMQYRGETGAIKEAYSDVFGEILEDYINDGQLDNDCDWKHGNRNMVAPYLGLKPASYGDFAWGDPSNEKADNGYVHDNSTVLSHAAYLMNKGTGGEPLSTEKLGRLWMNTLYLLQEDTDMHQMADTMINVAHRMEEQGLLTSKQLKAVYQAFYKTNLLAEKVGPKMTLEVRDSAGDPCESYYLMVYSHKTQKDIISQTVTTANPYELNLEKGNYTIIVADEEQKDSFSKTISVDDEIKTTTALSIITDFAKVDPIRMLNDYLLNTLVPKYGHGASFDCMGYQLFSKKSGTEIEEVLPDEGKGILSVYIEDLNGDSVSEMLVVRLEEHEILTELYAIQNNKVELSQKISSNFPFQTYGVNMEIFVVRNNDQHYICINDDFWGSTPNSAYSQTAFNVYRVTENGSVVTEHEIIISPTYDRCDDMYLYYREGLSYVSPTPAKKQAMTDALQAVADKLGTQSLKPYWSDFPDDGDVTRIYAAGCSMDYIHIYNGEAEPEKANVVSRDYTGTAKQYQIPQYGNVVDYGKRDGATWILYENGTLVLGATGGSLEFKYWHHWDGNTSTSIPIRKLIFDDSVQEISYIELEDDTYLTSVDIPASVTQIVRDDWLSYPDVLMRIWVDPANTAFYADRRGCLYNKDQSILLRVPPALTGTYRVPSNVTTIVEGAFSGCSNLTQIILPASVTYVAENAFGGCYAKVTSEGDVGTFTDQDGVLYTKGGKVLLQAPVTLKGSYTIPEGTQIVVDYAFADCKNLTSVYIPSSVKSVGYWAFTACGIQTVRYDGIQLQWANICHDSSLDTVSIQYEGKITSDQAELYAKYLKVIEQYEVKYGRVSLIDIGGSSYASGLCDLNLIDFDGDGSEELVLLYSTGSSWETLQYRLDIVTGTKTGTECIYSQALSMSEQWSGCTEYFSTTGEIYLISETESADGDKYKEGHDAVYYYAMEDGAFKLVKTIIEPDTEYCESSDLANEPVWIDDVRYTYAEYAQWCDKLRGFSEYSRISMSAGCDSDVERYEKQINLVKNTLSGT